MRTPVRKSICITREIEEWLKAKNKESGASEGEIIRRALQKIMEEEGTKKDGSRN
jgi:hypothetical protein